MATVTENDLKELKDLIKDLKTEIKSDILEFKTEVNNKLNNASLNQAKIEARLEGIEKRLENIEIINRTAMIGVLLSLSALRARQKAGGRRQEGKFRLEKIKPFCLAQLGLRPPLKSLILVVFG